MVRRSPIAWLHSVKTPMFVFEGAEKGNWESIQEMVNKNTNPKIQFFQVPGHDHFSVIAPLTEVLARQIVKGEIAVSAETVKDLK
jgi:hypothetical protein